MTCGPRSLSPRCGIGLVSYLEYGAEASREAALVGRAIKQSAGRAQDYTIGSTTVVASKDGHGAQGPGRGRGLGRLQYVDHAATGVRFRETGETRRRAAEGRAEDRGAAGRGCQVVRGKHRDRKSTRLNSSHLG